MPTREAAAYGVLTVLMIFVAVNLQAGWVYAVDALLVGFGAAGWITTALAGLGIRLSRSLPAEVTEGETFPVSLTAGAVRWPRFFLEVHDAVPGCDPGQGFIALLGRRGGAVTYRTTARRRGVQRAAAVVVRSNGVTGLFRSRRRVEAPGTITVLPRHAVLRRFPLPGLAGSHTVPFPLPSRSGLDVAGVRDFRPGDDPSRIHWRSTARRGALVVREFEREVTPGAALIVDARPAADPDGFEDLIRAAASVAHFITHRGRPVTLAVARGGSPHVATAGWMDALRTLAQVEPDPLIGPVELAGMLPPGTPVVVFTSSADAAAAVARGGRPVVAVLHDDGGQGSLLLEALGVPVRVLRRGMEVGACLDS